MIELTIYLSASSNITLTTAKEIRREVYYTVSGSERHIEGSVTIPAGQSSAKSTVYQLPTKPTNVYVGNW